MRGTALALLVLAPAAVTGALPAQETPDTPDDRPGIAVLPFHGTSVGPDAWDVTALQVGLQQILLTELAQNPALRIVERGELQRVLQEQELGASGRVEPGTAARIGELVGARYMVAGTFTDLAGDVRIDARVIDVETSEILGTEQVRDRRDEVYELMVQMAEKVVAGVELPPLPAATTEARRSREIPQEAVTLYAHALTAQDGGQTETAIDIYRRIVERFPEMTEAQEALRQLTGA